MLKSYNIHAVLFDLDGTLVESSLDITSALNKTLEEYNYSTVNIEQVCSWIGGGSRNLLKEALSLLDEKFVEDKMLKSFIKNYEDTSFSNTKAYPYTLDILKEIRKLQIPMVVVTNKSTRLATLILHNLSLMDYFEFVVGADCLPEKKPSPIPVIYASEKLKVKINKCLMVGDSAADFYSAQGAGAKIVLLNQGYRKGVVLEELKADFFLII